MPRRKNATPSYLKHKSSGLAYVILDGKPEYLGKHGSEESMGEYRRKIAEWKTRQSPGGAPAPIAGAPAGFQVRTVDDLIDAFWAHAEQHYRKPDGTPSGEIGAYRQSLRPLRRLYGHVAINDFGPVALETIQSATITGEWMTAEEKERYRKGGKKIGWCRKMINQRVARIRRVFKWGARKQLVPQHVYASLCTVPGLQIGRTKARDYEDVPPVPPEDVEAVFPHLGAVVQAMVRLQQYSGMRPGEVCSLRPRDIDRPGLKVGTQEIWVYRPKDHKGSWLGHKKAVALGPRAQAVLAPFLERPADAWCFSPVEELESLRQRWAAQSRFPSRRGANRVVKPKKTPGDCYTVTAYGTRIRNTCRRRSLAEFHPHQLRHLVGTMVDERYGLDAARAVLDHRDPKTTLIYAQRSLRKAAEIAAEIG